MDNLHKIRLCANDFTVSNFEHNTTEQHCVAWSGMAEELGTCQIIRNLLATASPTQCVQPFQLLPRAGPRQTEHKQQHCVSQFVSRIATIVCEFVNFLFDNPRRTNL